LSNGLLLQLLCHSRHLQSLRIRLLEYHLFLLEYHEQGAAERRGRGCGGVKWKASGTRKEDGDEDYIDVIMLCSGRLSGFGGSLCKLDIIMCIILPHKWPGIMGLLGSWLHLVEDNDSMDISAGQGESMFSTLLHSCWQMVLQGPSESKGKDSESESKDKNTVYYT